ncbi:pyridoxamine 5'-phosphate oxidase family protein [Paraburkholderia sp. JHI2823]|uniref:pyridoxamine 5'-phosphate oxidase family protein n=1 Tax=Paraburkholderia sp. JHI2823 TaxID=3112960 RepID=UPI00317D1037
MCLERIYTRLWQCLAAATREGPQPFKAMQVATIGLDGAPDVRTVLLRSVCEAQNLLTFHTDLRSPKVAALSREPRIALVAVDTDRNLQIRVHGEARIIRDGPARVDAWHSSDDRSLVAYRTLLAPGSPMSQPCDAFGTQPGIPGPEEGLKHFCVVEVQAACLEWLDLSAGDRPERARFVRAGETWVSGWIAP